jgi:hypothetical protein
MSNSPASRTTSSNGARCGIGHPRNLALNQPRHHYTFLACQQWPSFWLEAESVLRERLGYHGEAAKLPGLHVNNLHRLIRELDLKSKFEGAGHSSLANPDPY